MRCWSHSGPCQISPESLHACSVQLPEETHHAGLLTSSRGTVDQEVGEVSALHQQLQVVSLLLVVVKLGQLSRTVFVNPERHYYGSGVWNMKEIFYILLSTFHFTILLFTMEINHILV